MCPVLDPGVVWFDPTPRPFDCNLYISQYLVLESLLYLINAGISDYKRSQSRTWVKTCVKTWPEAKSWLRSQDLTQDLGEEYCCVGDRNFS